MGSSWRASTTRSRQGWPAPGEEHDFIGKEAYLTARDEEPAAILCTLTVEDHVSPRDGIKRYPPGGSRSPRPTAAGSSIGRADRPTSRPPGGALRWASSSDGLSAARARGRGQRSRRDVHERALSGESGGRRSTPLFDPDDGRMKRVRTLVCIKRVPAPGARIVLTDDQQAIDARHLPFTTSPHEECAGRGGGPDQGEARRHRGRDDPWPGRGRGTASLRCRSVPTRQCCWRRMAPIGIRRRRLPRSPPRRKSLRPAGTDSTSSSSATSRPTPVGIQVGIRVAHALGRPVIGGSRASTSRMRR